MAIDWAGDIETVSIVPRWFVIQWRFCNVSLVEIARSNVSQCLGIGTGFYVRLPRCEPLPAENPRASLRLSHVILLALPPNFSRVYFPHASGYRNMEENKILVISRVHNRSSSITFECNEALQVNIATEWRTADDFTDFHLLFALLPRRQRHLTSRPALFYRPRRWFIPFYPAQ